MIRLVFDSNIDRRSIPIRSIALDSADPVIDIDIVKVNYSHHGKYVLMYLHNLCICKLEIAVDRGALYAPMDPKCIVSLPIFLKCKRH